MKKIFSLIIVTITCIAAYAQTHMRIHHNGGGYSDVPIEKIDSITFVDNGDVTPCESELSGGWLWGSLDSGYYEQLSFSEDKTYTGYDNYFSYGFDAMTYGWYMQMGSMLTLQSNGFGYKRRYNWLILGLTDNALDVMTKMGRFVYYRVQPEVLHLKVDGEPLVCESGDSFLFADGVIASIANGCLQGEIKGTTYVLKSIEKTSKIVAYKVIVE